MQVEEDRFTLDRMTVDKDRTLTDDSYGAIAEVNFDSAAYEGVGWGFGLGSRSNKLQQAGKIYGELYNCAGDQMSAARLRAAVRTKTRKFVDSFFNLPLTAIDQGETTPDDRKDLYQTSFVDSDGNTREFVATGYLQLEVQLNDGESDQTFDSANSNNKVEIDGRRVYE